MILLHDAPATGWTGLFIFFMTLLRRTAGSHLTIFKIWLTLSERIYESGWPRLARRSGFLAWRSHKNIDFVLKASLRAKLEKWFLFCCLAFSLLSFFFSTFFSMPSFSIFFDIPSTFAQHYGFASPLSFCIYFLHVVEVQLSEYSWLCDTYAHSKSRPPSFSLFAFVVPCLFQSWRGF